MGHHAQYRKRGSTITGSPYALTAPTNAQWDVAYTAFNPKARFTVDAPAPATGIFVDWKTVTGEWTPGDGTGTKNFYFTIGTGVPSGLIYVRARWVDAGAGFAPKSDWSTAQTVTVP